MLLIVLQHLLVTAFLALCVFGLCRLFARHAAVCHLLWLIVLCKFLLPPLLSPWSISLLSQRPSDHELTIAATVDSFIPDATLAVVEFHSEFKEHTFATATPITALQRSVAAVASLPWQAVGAMLWLAGSVVLVVRYVRAARQIQRRMQDNRPPSKKVESVLHRTSSDLGLALPKIVSTDMTASPFVWSLSGQIAWPANDDALSDEQIRLMLAHELAHIRRRDHWVALLEMVGRIIWWWNPFYWWTVANLRHWAECACDANVVEQQPKLRGAYSRLLIELAALHSTNAGRLSPAALGISTSRKRFETRLTMVMQWNSKKLPLVTSASVVGLLAFLALLAIPSVHFAQLPQNLDIVNREESNTRSRDVPAEQPVPSGVLADVFNKLDESNLAEVNRQELVHASLRGMRAQQGEDAEYLRLLERKSVNSLAWTSHHILLDKQERVALRPMQDSLAWTAEVWPIDIVSSVDGVDIGQTTEMLLGSTLHQLKLRRDKKLLDVPVRRRLAQWPMNSVHPHRYGEFYFFDAKNEIGYMRISSFSLRTLRQTKRALSTILQREPRGLVIDLRHSRGGSISDAARVMDLCLAAGKIVDVKKRNSVNIELRSVAGPTDSLEQVASVLDSVPLVVLVNSETMSAAEVVAAALQEHQRGVVVGQRAGGVGTLTSCILLGSGGWTPFPVGVLVHPNGREVSAGISLGEGKLVDLTPRQYERCHRVLRGTESDTNFVESQLAVATGSIDAEATPKGGV